MIECVKNGYMRIFYYISVLAAHGELIMAGERRMTASI